MVRRRTRFSLVFVVIFSLILGMLVNVMPLPPSLLALRPEFVCLAVLYWVVSMPQHMGVFFAWSVGFFQDIVEGTVWGAHGLALTLLAYICLLSWQQIRNYSVWHQSIWVFVLVGTHQVIVSWVQSLAGYNSAIHHILLPAVVSALIWPAIFNSLQGLSTRLRLSEPGHV